MRVGRPEITCLLLLTDHKLQEYTSYTKKLSRTTNVTAFPECMDYITFKHSIIHILNDCHCVYEYNGMCICSYYIFITPGKVTIIVNGLCICMLLYRYIYIFVKPGKATFNGR